MDGLRNNKKKVIFCIKRIFVISFVAVSLLALVFIGYDILLKVENKINAQNMGKFENRSEWIDQMKNRAIKEYKHMPRLKGNLGFPRLMTQFRIDKHSPIYAWQAGGLLLGIYECTTEEEFIEIVNKRNDLLNLTGEEIDSALLAYALSYVTEDEYPDKEQINNRVLESIYANLDTQKGTLMYRTVYPSFRFIDTIGLVCPFLVRIEEGENKGQYEEMALSQLLEYEELAFNDDYDYLPFHGYDFESDAPLGKYGWGRGTGWYALGLIDTYQELEDDKRIQLENSIIKLAEAIKKYQKDDGGWGGTVNVISSQTDTSATALFLYFIKLACKLELIEKESYLVCIEAAEKCLMSNTLPNGRVINTEGDCIALGNYSYDYKYMPFTLGMTLRAVCLE
ncbi:MAG: hypothetical protein GX129_04390 [Clostridiales bacterium]|jgi:unsaturated rhamnogalacturonyl hydrolase|nr:hypothetical protein [Clostridiales bacterium]